MQNLEVLLSQSILIGVGATVFMDIWSLLQKRLLGIPSLDFALVGRWVGHMSKGQFVHNPIMAAGKCSGEAAIGWFSHYAIGVIFAAMLLFVVGIEWSENPTLLPAILVGLMTVAAPLLIMQPAFGFGFAASRTPKPNMSRLKSVVTHLSFGLGLYVSAECLRLVKVLSIG